nr:hypothetical protein [Tanacetum cinerariifolium]
MREIMRDKVAIISVDLEIEAVKTAIRRLKTSSVGAKLEGEGGYRVRHDYAGFEIQVAGAVVRLQGVQVVTPSYQQTTIVVALAETLQTVLRNIADMSQQ